MTRTIAIAPLTTAAFAPFGQVITTAGAELRLINAGMTQRFHDLAQIELGGADPRPLISIFHSKPYPLPLKLTMVERHPLGSQAFFPLSDRPFLSIVAPDDNGTPGVPQAFLVPPGTGVNIAMNTWHGVLTPLGDTVADFLVVDRGGPGDNLEEFYFETPWTVASAA